MSIKAYKGLVVPFPCKKEWKWMLDSNAPRCNNCERDSNAPCIYINCMDCVYNTAVAKADYYKHCFPEERPELTIEVFDRPDCPEWARWAAVDINGQAAWYSKKPVLWKDESSTWHLLNQWYRNCTDEDPFGGMVKLMTKRFDASNWEHSLIERPAKDLPKLTQTAFHCPDCPKEAAKLKVFPANHVVALDKDDKVLQVMDLQCKEGEIERPESDWYYSSEADQFYYKVPRSAVSRAAVPVKVEYMSQAELKGEAVTDKLTGKSVIITGVRDNLVYVVGEKGKDVMSMVTLIINYRFSHTNWVCCYIEYLE